MKYLPSQLLYLFQNKAMRKDIGKLSKFLLLLL